MRSYIGFFRQTTIRVIEVKRVGKPPVVLRWMDCQDSAGQQSLGQRFRFISPSHTNTGRPFNRRLVFRLKSPIPTGRICTILALRLSARGVIISTPHVFSAFIVAGPHGSLSRCRSFQRIQ